MGYISAVVLGNTTDEYFQFNITVVCNVMLLGIT